LSGFWSRILERTQEYAAQVVVVGDDGIDELFVFFGFPILSSNFHVASWPELSHTFKDGLARV
jgi:hypothetical protein